MFASVNLWLPHWLNIQEHFCELLKLKHPWLGGKGHDSLGGEVFMSVTTLTCIKEIVFRQTSPLAHYKPVGAGESLPDPSGTLSSKKMYGPGRDHLLYKRCFI